MSTLQPFRQRVSVLIADGSQIHSQLLAETLAKDERISVVGFGSTSDCTVLAATENPPDVLLISARLEEQPLRGLDVLRQIRATQGDLKAIVLLDSSKPDIVVDAFRAGACGVFCRNNPIEALYKCILAVYEGQIWANSKELGFVLKALTTYRSFETSGNYSLSILSSREREVVQCLAEALSNREIAERLKISEHTVKNYMFRIFEKMGVSSRVELIFHVLSRVNASRDRSSMAETRIARGLRQSQ